MVAWHCEMFTGRSGDTTIVASCMVTVWSLNTTIIAPRMSRVKRTDCLLSPRWKPCYREVRKDELFHWRCLMQERLVYDGLRPFVNLETIGELKPKYVPQLFLGSLLGTRWAAVGQFFLVPGNNPRGLCEVNSAQSSSRPFLKWWIDWIPMKLCVTVQSCNPTRNNKSLYLKRINPQGFPCGIKLPRIIKI